MAPQADYLVQMQAEILRVLPTRSKREKDAFAALDVNEQAWRFMNWQSRLVHPHPRQVCKADGLDSLPAVQSRQQDVQELLANIARGHDVTDYLSKDAMQGYCLHPPGRKDGRDFDLLLNEWGIHHLHIPTPGKGDYKRGSDELLYAIFERGVAFVLAVAPHGEWTSKQLVKAAVQSWPNRRLFIPLDGILPGRDWMENEHKALRKYGMTTAAVVDEKSWISSVTLGLSTALVSARVVNETCRVMRCLHQATNHPENLARQMMDHAAANGASWPAKPLVNVRWFCGPDRYCFGLVEEVSGATLLI